MTLRAVFLDAGNTLVGLDYEAIARGLGAEGHAVDVIAVRGAEQRARVRLDPYLGAHRSTERADVFARYVRYLGEELGIEVADRGARLVASLRSTAPPLGLWSVCLPEARAALEMLRGLGLRLAVVSNSDGSVARILEALGLARWLDAIVDSAVVGFEKPDPRIFQHAARALGVAPAEAIHVGDLYSVDVLGARAAGTRAILLDPIGAWSVNDCPKVPDVAAAARLIAGMT